MRKTSGLLGLLVIVALSACGSTSSTKNSSGETVSSSPTTSPTTGSTTPGTTGETTPVTTGGTTPGTTDVDSPDVSALIDRDWNVDGMITIAGVQPVPSGSTAALRFSDNGDGTGNVEVDSGCNTGSATLTYTSADELAVGPIALTRKACSDELNALETSLVGQLENPLSWSVDGDVLNLIPTNVSDSGLQLHDAAVTETTDPPGTSPGPTDTELRRLLGTEWIPERFITVGPLDSIPAGSGASLRFDDASTIAVNTGCNSGTGTVTFADDGTFTVTDLVMTEIACDDISLEVRILAQLEHPLQWGIDGDTLTIYPIDVTDTGIILRDAAGEPEPTTTISDQDAAATDRAAILGAAALARRQSSDTDIAGIAIVENLGTSGADGMVVFGPDDVPITDAERAAIEAALAPVTVLWVESLEPALKTAAAAGQVDAGIALSDPAIEGDTATVMSDLVFPYPGGDSQGGGLALDRQPDGSWEVSGPFGTQWIF